MAKNTNSKRTARMEKNNRNMNRAMTLLTAGFLAEFYLLLINNYFVKGTIGQIAVVSYALKYILYFGIVFVAAGIVLLMSKKKEKDFSAASIWLVICGVFFTLSSELMLKIYPQGTTLMCIVVPVAMILGIIFLMYQHEFSMQTLALTASISAMALLNRGAGKPNWSAIVKAYSALAAAGVLVLLVLAYLAQKNEGCIKEFRVFPIKTDYKLMYAVLVVCLLAILAALFVGGIAFYGIWALSILLFVLAVYYTVKML